MTADPVAYRGLDVNGVRIVQPGPPEDAHETRSACRVSGHG
jgi:hypothetical protein